jgi:hypothetical protein
MNPPTATNQAAASGALATSPGVLVVPPNTHKLVVGSLAKNYFHVESGANGTRNPH